MVNQKVMVYILIQKAVNTKDNGLMACSMVK